MSGLTLKNIKKVYQKNITAVHDFSLEVKDREFIVLVGPSGCGKSTILRMIAGLEDITGGELYIGDRLMNEVAPKDRNIAMVFQNYALYPHMTVFQNIAFSLKMQKLPKMEIKKIVEDTAKSLDISELLERKPKELSGGQKQRVALGRAMVRNPSVFLLDEPLSNLDAKLRGQMRIEISELHRKLRTTFVYVTHDQIEAMTMADRIVVMKDGLIMQIDTPRDLYDSPDNMFVAGFLGVPAMNFSPALLTKENDEYNIKMLDNVFPLKTSKLKDNALDAYINKEVIAGIRPENIFLANKKSEFSAMANIDIIEDMGMETVVYMSYKDEKFSIRLNSDLAVWINKDTKNAIICFDISKLHMFDKDTAQTI